MIARPRRQCPGPRAVPAALAGLLLAAGLAGACARAPAAGPNGPTAPATAGLSAGPGDDRLAAGTALPPPGGGPASAAEAPLLAPGEAPPAAYVRSFAFLPGTADLAFEVAKGYPGIEGAPLFVQRLDPDRGQPRWQAEPLAEAPAAGDGSFDGVWSGARGGPLFAGLGRPDAAYGDIVSISAGEGAGAVPVPVAREVASLAVAPDGGRLAIIDGAGRLRLLEPASGEDRTLGEGFYTVAGGPGADLAFLPDGSAVLAVTSSAAEGAELARYDLGTGARATLARTAGPEFIAAFAGSPDAGRVYYVVARQADARPGDGAPLYDQALMAVDSRPGATPRRLADIATLTGSRAPVGDLALPPDGRTLLLEQGGGIHRLDWAVPSATRLAPVAAEERVYDGPLLSTVAGVTWMAYSVVRDLGDDSPYPAYGGGRAAEALELRLLPLD